MIGDVGIQIQAEDGTDHLVVIQRLQLILAVTPAHTVGLCAGEGEPAIGMLGSQSILLLLGQTAAATGVGSDRQMGQRQIVQRRQICNMGITDVQHLQIGAVSQRRYIRDVFTEGSLQQLQILTAAEGLQALDGRTGNDNIFQALHAGNEVAGIQPFIVADVHILGIFTIDQIVTVIVHQIVDRADNFRIRQSAALAIGHTPDNLGPATVVVTDLCHGLVGDLTVFQNKTLAILQKIQSIADGLLPFITDFGILDMNLFIRGGQGIAVEIKGEIKYHIGHSFHQILHILQRQGTNALLRIQIHTGQQRQLLDLLRCQNGIIRSHTGKIQLGGIRFILNAQNLHSMGDGNLRICSPQLIQLFQRQCRIRQFQRLQLGQIDQIGHQLVEITILRESHFQRSRIVIYGNR